jgi:ATP-dependent Lhr-like helicase
MNVGAIVESEMLDVRSRRIGRRPTTARVRRKAKRTAPLVAGSALGQIEEYFIEGLAPGDTFLFAGEILRLSACAKPTRSWCVRR